MWVGGDSIVKLTYIFIIIFSLSVSTSWLNTIFVFFNAVMANYRTGDT